VDARAEQRCGAEGNDVSWRGKHPVLVVQADTLGALAVIRSLGRAGYPVHACSTETNAVGFASRFPASKVVCPSYGSAQFLPWLRDYVHRHGIEAIVPSESLLLCLRPVLSEFAPLLCCSQDEETLYAALSKFDLFERLTACTSSLDRDHLPPTLLIPDTRFPSASQELRQLPTPLYVKVDGSYASRAENGGVFKSASAEEALALLKELAPRFRKAIVQGHVPGRGVGAFFLIHRGEVRAEFMHLRLHETPHTGGASSFRQSWRHSAIREDALSKLRRMNWEGVAMMEYRWDPVSDRFYLMELNSRFWGSLHLALWSGVDFPRLLLDAFHGRPSPPTREYPLGVRCRYTFPGEIQYVVSRLRDPSLKILAKIWSVLEFFVLSLNPGIHSDLAFPKDHQPYFSGIKGSIEWIKKSFLRESLQNCHATQ